jgi:hypothetical protein
MGLFKSILKDVSLAQNPIGNLKTLKNTLHDAEGLVNPMNYYRTGKEAVTNPVGLAKGIGNSYLDLGRHPLRALQHPLSTGLMIAPGVGQLGKLGILGKAGEAADVVAPAASREELFRRAATRARGPAHTTPGVHTFSTTDGQASAVRQSLDTPTQWGVNPAKGEAASAAAVRAGLDKPTQWRINKEPESTHWTKDPAHKGYEEDPILNGHDLGDLHPGIEHNENPFDFAGQSQNIFSPKPRNPAGASLERGNLVPFHLPKHNPMEEGKPIDPKDLVRRILADRIGTQYTGGRKRGRPGYDNMN